MESSADIPPDWSRRIRQLRSTLGLTAVDPLLLVLEGGRRLTLCRREGGAAVFLGPGEPVFDRLRSLLCSRFARKALRDGVFVDPYAQNPYLFHLTLIAVLRRVDPRFRPFAREECLEYRLVGLRQREDGSIEQCPVESLLLLKEGRGIPSGAWHIVRQGREAREAVRAYAMGQIARPLAAQRQATLLETLPSREAFVVRGHDYQDAEMATLRPKLGERVRAGDQRAQAELARLRERQRNLADRREEALAVLRREPELVEPEEVAFLAHALVVPSSDPDDRRRHDDEVEAIAVRVTVAYEEARGATVRDVSIPARSVGAGLGEYPGFDLLSTRPQSEERAIEVKGRVGVGDVELTDNEWAKACNLGDRFWLYVVFDCGTPHPRLLRVRHPFKALLVQARGGVIVDEQQVLAAAERDE